LKAVTYAFPPGYRENAEEEEEDCHMYILPYNSLFNKNAVLFAAIHRAYTVCLHVSDRTSQGRSFFLFFFFFWKTVIDSLQWSSSQICMSNHFLSIIYCCFGYFQSNRLMTQLEEFAQQNGVGVGALKNVIKSLIALPNCKFS
jgi:hypothetical protein